MKKSQSHRDTVAEAMGVNPATLPPEPEAVPALNARQIREKKWLEQQAQAGQPATPSLEGPDTVLNAPRHFARKGIFSTMCNAPKPVLDFVLPGLTRGCLGLLISPGGLGKSFWTLEMAISMATGIDLVGLHLVGHTLKQGPVTYISLEDNMDTIHGRSQDFYDQNPLLWNQKAMDDGDNNLTIRELYRGDFDLYKDDDTQKSMGTLAEAMEELMAGQRLVIIDTLNQSHSGKESDNDDMGVVMGHLRKYASIHKCAVLVIHHTTKAATLNGQGGMAEASRGAGALVASARVVFAMEGMSEEMAKAYGLLDRDRWEYSKIGVAKINGGAKFEQWYKKHEGGVLHPLTMQLKDATPKRPANAKTKAKAKPAGQDLHFGV